MCVKWCGSNFSLFYKKFYDFESCVWFRSMVINEGEAVLLPRFYSTQARVREQMLHTASAEYLISFPI